MINKSNEANQFDADIKCHYNTSWINGMDGDGRRYTETSRFPMRKKHGFWKKCEEVTHCSVTHKVRSAWVQWTVEGLYKMLKLRLNVRSLKCIGPPNVPQLPIK